MPKLIFIAILAVGVLVVGLLLSSLVKQRNVPQTIHNPYVNR